MTWLWCRLLKLTYFKHGILVWKLRRGELRTRFSIRILRLRVPAVNSYVSWFTGRFWEIRTTILPGGRKTVFFGRIRTLALSCWWSWCVIKRCGSRLTSTGGEWGSLYKTITTLSGLTRSNSASTSKPNVASSTPSTNTPSNTKMHASIWKTCSKSKTRNAKDTFSPSGILTIKSI